MITHKNKCVQTNFCVHKYTSQAKMNHQNKNKLTLNNKGNNVLRAQTSKRVKVVCFMFWCFLCTRNLFVKKKKKKQAWNCLDNLILLYYWWKHEIISFYPNSIGNFDVKMKLYLIFPNHMSENFWFLKLQYLKTEVWSSFLACA